jgi:chemotaxis protein methyltransferase CheR
LHAASAPPAPSWLTPEQFLRFRNLLAAFSGVHLDITRQRWLEQSLARRLAATGDSLAGYEQRLGGAPDELRRLAELVLNHETLFFRNGPHFQALRNVLLPELHRQKPAGAPIRIWSAGCSTGEEAYSLAITALEALGQPPARPVEIWATDLSEPALQKARAGVYRGRTLQNVPDAIAQRYFTSQGDNLKIGAAARALVRFEQLNLLEAFPRAAQGVDLIFCQNVTIYFQLTTCRELIARFYQCLPVGGLLFLGFSETLWNVFDRFQTREVAGAYLYIKGEPEPARKPAARAAPPLGRAGGAVPPAPARQARRPAAEPARPLSLEQRGREQLARGHALLAEGQLDAALEALRLVPPQSADAPVALTLVARIHADRGDLELAAAEAQRAIEINPLSSEAQLLLGIIYSRQAQWPGAIQQLERARYLDQTSALASFHLAEAYRQSERANKAGAEYRNTLQKLEQHPPGTLLDGVAVEWLRETCQRQIEYAKRSSKGKQGA